MLLSSLCFTFQFHNTEKYFHTNMSVSSGNSIIPRSTKPALRPLIAYYLCILAYVSSLSLSQLTRPRKTIGQCLNNSHTYYTPDANRNTVRCSLPYVFGIWFNCCLLNVTGSRRKCNHLAPHIRKITNTNTQHMYITWCGGPKCVRMVAQNCLVIRQPLEPGPGVRSSVWFVRCGNDVVDVISAIYISWAKCAGRVFMCWYPRKTARTIWPCKMCTYTHTHIHVRCVLHGMNTAA